METDCVLVLMAGEAGGGSAAALAALEAAIRAEREQVHDRAGVRYGGHTAMQRCGIWGMVAVSLCHFQSMRACDFWVRS